MPRIKTFALNAALAGTTALSLGLSLGFAPAAQAQDSAPLQGTWMAIGDMLSLLPGNIEVLTVEGETVSSTLFHAFGDCADGDCAMPQPVMEGTLTIDALSVTFTPSGDAQNPFPAEPAWPFLALEGGAWTMFRQDSQLMISREAEIAGNSVPLLRIFLAVAPEVPAAFYEYLYATQTDIARTLCPMTLMHANPGPWAAFTADITAAAPAFAAARTGTGEAGTGEASAEAQAAADQLLAWAGGNSDLPEGTALLPALPYPGPVAMVEPAQDCLTRAFGG